MYMEVSRGGSVQLKYTEYVVESESDLQKLPADEKLIAIGSKAFMADGSAYTFFGNLKKWVKIKDPEQGGGSSIDPDDVATDDEVEELIDDIFGDTNEPDNAATDDEVGELIDDIFGDTNG